MPLVTRNELPDEAGSLNKSRGWCGLRRAFFRTRAVLVFFLLAGVFLFIERQVPLLRQCK